VAYYGHYAHEMAGGLWPYRDFFDEYPPLASRLFLLVRLLPGSFEGTFRWTMALCGVAVVVLLTRRSAWSRRSSSSSPCCSSGVVWGVTVS
jgi:hypothetical protein